MPVELLYLWEQQNTTQMENKKILFRPLPSMSVLHIFANYIFVHFCEMFGRTNTELFCSYFCSVNFYNLIVNVHLTRLHRSGERRWTSSLSQHRWSRRNPDQRRKPHFLKEREGKRHKRHFRENLSKAEYIWSTLHLLTPPSNFYRVWVILPLLPTRPALSKAINLVLSAESVDTRPAKNNNLQHCGTFTKNISWFQILHWWSTLHSLSIKERTKTVLTKYLYCCQIYPALHIRNWSFHSCESALVVIGGVLQDVHPLRQDDYVVSDLLLVNHSQSQKVRVYLEIVNMIIQTCSNIQYWQVHTETSVKWWKIMNNQTANKSTIKHTTPNWTVHASLSLCLEIPNGNKEAFDLEHQTLLLTLSHQHCWPCSPRWSVSAPGSELWSPGQLSVPPTLWFHLQTSPTLLLWTPGLRFAHPNWKVCHQVLKNHWKTCVIPRQFLSSPHTRWVWHAEIGGCKAFFPCQNTWQEAQRWSNHHKHFCFDAQYWGQKPIWCHMHIQKKTIIKKLTLFPDTYFWGKNQQLWIMGASVIPTTNQWSCFTIEVIVRDVILVLEAKEPLVLKPVVTVEHVHVSLGLHHLQCRVRRRWGGNQPPWIHIQNTNIFKQEERTWNAGNWPLFPYLAVMF